MTRAAFQVKGKSNTQVAAERRAKLAAFLEQQGTPQDLAQIMAGMGLNESAAQNLALSMAKSGLIERGKRGPKYVYFSKTRPSAEPELLPAAQAPRQVVARGPYNKKGTVAALNGSVPPGVELVIGGVLVVFGKNPATGRLRITLDPQ